MLVPAPPVHAGVGPALVDVDLAVRPVKPLVAAAAVGVALAHAVAVGAAGVVGAVVDLGAVLAWK